jgi:hypothetical protein
MGVSLNTGVRTKTIVSNVQINTIKRSGGSFPGNFILIVSNYVIIKISISQFNYGIME